MRILCLVKRVPAPGARINITDDEQYVDDKNLGHACLLYTSPSPRDATLSRMPSSA